MTSSAAAPLALTMGDPAGIGGEIALKAWLKLRRGGPCFFCIDDPGRLAGIAADLGLAVPIAAIDRAEQADGHFARALPVLPLRLEPGVRPGRPDVASAGAIVASIDRAVELARRGAAAAVVTNPISKEVLLDAGFRHAGHTDYLAELAGGVPVEMMLVCPGLRVVPMTVHRPLRAAVEAVRREAVIGCARRTARALQEDFGVARPRIVVAGLNPHAGENGTIGREDIEEIAPAVAALRAEGLDIRGPLPADSLFHEQARAAYDAAVCMYHDQALIPIKTIDFWGGVNVTIGLPFVRTSPDHGTAFDIAGRSVANPASLIAALRLASDMARRRAAAHAG